MSIQLKLFYNEITKIIASGDKGVAYEVLCDIHIGSKTIRPYMVNFVERDRDYIKNVCETLSVSVSMNPSDRDYHLVPNKSILEVTLYYKPLYEEVRLDEKITFQMKNLKRPVQDY